MEERPRNMADDTDEIREAMRIYVETWILPVIDELLSNEVPRDHGECRAYEALRKWDEERELADD